MVERKASDVLIDLASSQNEILSYIRNIKLTNELILKKIQVLEQKFSTSSVFEKSSEEIVFPEEETQPKSKLQIALELDEEKQLEEDANISIGRRSRTEEPSMRKIPVSQRIIYKDGKNVYMANVEFFNSEKKLVKKTRTNASGKWIVALPPSSYVVKITKAATSVKTKVDLLYTIVVTESDKQIELEEKISE